jgi:hypothetical protein
MYLPRALQYAIGGMTIVAFSIAKEELGNFLKRHRAKKRKNSGQ